MDGAAGRGISLPDSSSQASRKEWRAISEQSLRISTSEEIDCSKLGQSDERLVYEQGREPADVDFCSITIRGNPDNDLLQQRLHTVKKQREELQHMEIELRAQIITRSEILELQKAFDAEVQEQANAGMKLQEQLREMDQKICELERRMEEKERELQAIRLDNEAAWAKEGLLREQNKELQTYRRDRDNSEAERVQNIKQIHELQEHIQEKERQFMELQEQNRIAKETIIYNDEQMREAHAWMSRAQEIEAFQQAELRERAEQYNQLWLACQRQFGEMERLHLHIQQLQIVLTEARERNGTSPDCSQVSDETSKGTSQYELKNGSKLNENSNSQSFSANPRNVPNGNAETALSITSVGNVSTQCQSDLHGVALHLSSLHGMPTFMQPGQITALHPFLVHQQGVTTVPSQIPHHLGHFHPVPSIPSLQHWTNQQVSSEVGSQMSVPSQNHLQMEPTLLRPESSYEHDTSINGTLHHPEIEPKASVGVSCELGQQVVLQSVGENCIPSLQTPQRALQTISPQFCDALNIDPLEHINKFQGKNSNSHGVEAEGLIMGEVSSSTNKSSAEVSDQTSHSIDKVKDVLYNDAAPPERLICTGQNNAHACTGKAAEPNLLKEQALLACIVRTIPPGPGGRIRISTTLPNRLEKMLSPLHWLDYRKKFGKLDEFVASHPELFVIDGDYIQLREGAQEIIAATSAAARVAAAAAAAATSSSSSSCLPSVVAVTPMAQSQWLKKTSGDVEKVADNICYEFMAMQNQQCPPDVVIGGIIPRVKVLMKPKNAPRDAPTVQFSMSNTNLVGKEQARIGRFTSSSKR
ncbi:hypothetical protein DM860_013003 [Cuscuta australis]|uniref:DUF7725 domain-containing protein n=1 Tax=Cuscuta australis TaxID=267555 RepID=A0A328D1Z5_9ASTE|nr:hypothetical protein DM860_013003 [Cuscuta australis]